jgi:uncharacterized membrane protein
MMRRHRNQNAQTGERSMTWFLAGFVLFFGAHCVAIVAPAWRDRMAAKIGPGAWKGLYSLVSIVGFVLMIRGYGMMRLDPVVLYTPAPWLRHVTALLLLPVFPMLLAAYFPGRLKATLKHPMLAAVKLWALAHLLSNGTLGDVLLFGGFLAWAVADRISLKRRQQRTIPTLPASRFNDVVAVVLGLVLYVVFVKWLHVRLFGVLPLPGTF